MNSKYIIELNAQRALYNRLYDAFAKVNDDIEATRLLLHELNTIRDELGKGVITEYEKN